MKNMQFKNIKKDDSEKEFNIPKIGFDSTPVKAAKTKKTSHLKRNFMIIVVFLITLLGSTFAAFYYLSQWYETHRPVFQQPVILQTPVFIETRTKIIGVNSNDGVFINFPGPINPAEAAGLKDNNAVMPQAQPMPLSMDVVKTLIHNRTAAEWDEGEWDAMQQLIFKESGFQPYIINKSSGACGIFQFLPCTKIKSMDITVQIEAGIAYIKQRYGTPSQAWAFHQRNGWY